MFGNRKDPMDPDRYADDCRFRHGVVTVSSILAMTSAGIVPQYRLITLFFLVVAAGTAIKSVVRQKQWIKTVGDR